MADRHPDVITEQRKDGSRLERLFSTVHPIVRYFRCQVEPHVPDAWVDREKIRTAYEINFNRHFYKYTSPRPLAEIDTNLKQMEGELSAC